MLCPVCGVNVGDTVSLCPVCLEHKEARERLEREASAIQTQEPGAEIAIHSAPSASADTELAQGNEEAPYSLIEFFGTNFGLILLCLVVYLFALLGSFWILPGKGLIMPALVAMLGLGIFCSLLGGFMLALAIAAENLLLGLLCLIFPVLGYVFLWAAWPASLKPLLIHLAGVFIILLSVLSLGVWQFHSSAQAFDALHAESVFPSFSR